MGRHFRIGASCLGCLVALTACDKMGNTQSTSSKNTQLNDRFVSQLDAGGYFKDLSPTAAEALKGLFQKKGWAAIFSADSPRLQNADAEDLAEGGVGKFIRRITPYLAAHGVHLPEIHDDFTEAGYTVLVGTTRYKIYDAAEVKGDEYSTWGVAPARAFAIVDDLLAAAGSPERLYAVGDGNDLFAMFLTPGLHKIVCEHPDAAPRQRPYKPTEEEPYYGRGHECPVPGCSVFHAVLGNAPRLVASRPSAQPHDPVVPVHPIEP